ncbi:MAG: metallophosphoesterase family protein [Planctomycetes bacterium]|nr:metallophosphoesterase family protein [Planctomycetota bacterium]
MVIYLIAAAIFFIFGIIFIMEVFNLLAMLGIKEPPYAFLKIKIVKIGLHAIATVIFLCMIWAIFIEPYQLSVTRLDIHTDKLAAGRVFRIAFLTDMHCSGKTSREEEIPAIIRDFNPDIMLFGGDYLNSAKGFPVLKEMVAGLPQPVNGIYGVYGNWDKYINVFRTEDAGIKELAGSLKVRLGESDIVSVSGMDYHPHNKSFEKIKTAARDNEYNILVTHKPDLIYDIEGLKTDLYLCGHTHGGQVRVPFYGAIVTLSKYGKEFEMGEYDVDGTKLYVSRGVGVEGGWLLPPLRFLCKPEVVLITISGRRTTDSGR